MDFIFILIVFIVSVTIYWLIPKQFLRNIFLSFTSLLFIYYFDSNAFYLVLALSIITYLFAILISNFKKKIFLVSGILIQVLILVLFKYLGFLENVFKHLFSFISHLPDFKINFLFLPLGLSYIVFKHISYLVDVKMNITKSGRFFDFLFYSSFFTIYFAGPIERFERFKPQVEEEIKFSGNFIYEGFKRIAYGMFKKFVIADWLNYFIIPVFENIYAYSNSTKILALFGFSLQIYFDFAGYSDIAIGSSRFFGIKIMENFNYPYLKENISQFWRNWHISLSDWIRDYLFFPLSNLSNNKIWLMIFVPLISMGLCGLWHGASLNFLVWGLYHGAGLSFLQFWNLFKKKNKTLFKLSQSKIFYYFSILLTFVFVTIGWIFFIIKF